MLPGCESLLKDLSHIGFAGVALFFAGRQPAKKLFFFPFIFIFLVV
jgi:hypothetical protein